MRIRSGSSAIALRLLIGLCLSALSAHAAIPKDGFVYQGKPVHPSCLVADEGRKAIDLKACSTTADARMKVTQNNGQISADGAGPGGGAYYSYKVLDRRSDTFVLYQSWSGGGSGHFTALLAVRKAGPRLIVQKTITGGDRCNGGIADYSSRGGMLRYSFYITPFDMIALAGPSKLQAYKDLSASASSCVATQDWEYDPATGQNHAVSVTLTGAHFQDVHAKERLIADQPGWTEKYRYEHCFNGFYNSYVRRGQLVLTPEEISGFVKGFKAACVK